MEGIETSAVEFFAENELPPLPIVRNTKNTIEMAFSILITSHPLVQLPWKNE
jgi:hypothetical protein